MLKVKRQYILLEIKKTFPLFSWHSVIPQYPLRDYAVTENK